jgi:hypothetical protein
MAKKKMDREESDKIFTLQTNAEGKIPKPRRVALPQEDHTSRLVQGWKYEVIYSR